MSTSLACLCRRWLALLVMLSAFNVSAATSIKTVTDLRVLKAQSEEVKLPILLLFSAEDCDYCEAIRQNYLIPMKVSGEYVSRILFRQVYIENFSYIRDSSGKLIGGDQLALKYGVEVTPTILFIDAQGKELAERIIGLSGADYFDYILDTQIFSIDMQVPEIVPGAVSGAGSRH